MYLIQILLPLFDNARKGFPKVYFHELAEELTGRFGGVTAYSHAPAEGHWQKKGGRAKRDQIIVYEVMSKRLNRRWWTQKRFNLERKFRQQHMVIRGFRVTEL